MDDGGKYKPSRPQSWLWQCWIDYWDQVSKIRQRERADLYWVLNGDAVEGGPHHGTTQIISANPEAQAYVADRIFGVPKALKPQRTFVIRGTETHVGPSGASEEALAKQLHAEPDPETETWSWWRLRLEIHDVLLDFTHHGRQGYRPWTEANAVALLAAQVFFEHARRQQRHPDIAVRSHMHRYGDSGSSHPTRVIQTPAWQLKTAYAHKVAAESLSDVGGVVIVLRPKEVPDVRAILFTPELPKPWAASA